MDAVGDVTVSPGKIVNFIAWRAWVTWIRRLGGDALRKSKAAEPGVDHAFGPLPDDDDIVSFETPLAILTPFVRVSDRCLLSVMAPDFTR